MRHTLTLLALLSATTAQAQSCGGDFGAFIEGLKTEAVQSEFDPAVSDPFFAGIQQDPAVIRADRAQGVFQRAFIDFSRRLISQGRIDNARANADRYDSTFDVIEAQYGVPRGVLLAFWAFETDFGQVQGDFNTANALVTLAHDCRRPALFRPQIFCSLRTFPAWRL